MEILVEDLVVRVDINKTKEFYTKQNEIIEDCNCEDCSFYYKDFINREYRFLKHLTSCGIDLKKNLNNEPTGVSCIRNDSGEVINITQVFHVKGEVLSLNERLVLLKEVEGNLVIKLRYIVLNGTNDIDIELEVNKLEEPII